MLGVEGSPSCSVTRAPVLAPDGRRVLEPGSGLFFRALVGELEVNGLGLPLIGIPECEEAGDLDEALADVEKAITVARTGLGGEAGCSVAES